MKETLGCAAGGIGLLIIWFISTAIMAAIVVWLFSLFGVAVPFWAAFAVIFILGLVMR